MARDDGYFRLRIPDDLKAKVAEAAAANHRSMTAEIVFALRERMAAAGEQLAGDAPAAATVKGDRQGAGA